MQKNLLLTGASTGLGVGIAVKAAQTGYKVYATMRDPKRRDTLDAALQLANVRAEVLELDVGDNETIEAAVAKIIDADGQIDVLVNNAGVGFARTTEQALQSDIDWVMDVNFNGVVRCTKAVLPHMRARRSGHIVSITSVGGLVGQPFNEIYCASKFAVEGYMESLASYVGPSFGLNFTTIEPGGIVSEFANRAFEHFAATGGMLEDEYLPIIEKYLAGVRGRSGNDGVYQTADEVAGVVLDCLAMDSPPVRARTSDWAERFCDLKTSADPDGKLQQRAVVDALLGGWPDDGE